MGAMENYNRVTFEALSRLDAKARIRELQEVFRAAEVRYADIRARLMSKYYDLVTEMGGPEEARTRVRARGQTKIGFMKRLPGVGDKRRSNDAACLMGKAAVMEEEWAKNAAYPSARWNGPTMRRVSGLVRPTSRVLVGRWSNTRRALAARNCARKVTAATLSRER
jgi:hypothetical protein